jgi:nicotinamidase-related amidase
MAGFLLVLSACSLSTSGPPIAPEGEPKTALVLLDLQKDFLAQEGRMPVASHQVEPLLSAIRRLLAVAPEREVEVVYVVNEFGPGDWPANWFRNHAAIRGQAGTAKDPRVPVVEAPTFAKSAPDAFSNSDFDAHLRALNVDHLVIAGVFAGGCVKHTARGALNRAYRVTILRDAVADTSDQRVVNALADLTADGAAIRSSSEVIQTIAQNGP